MVNTNNTAAWIKMGKFVLDRTKGLKSVEIRQLDQNATMSLSFEFPS
jgi:hypothetical protein